MHLGFSYPFYVPLQTDYRGVYASFYKRLGLIKAAKSDKYKGSFSCIFSTFSMAMVIKVILICHCCIKHITKKNRYKYIHNYNVYIIK